MSILLDGTAGITTPGLTNTGTETLVNLTTTGNTTLGDATTDTLTVGVTGIVKDASGNVGIGTASPTVYGTYKTLEVRGTGGGVVQFGTGATTAAYVYSDGTNSGFNNLVSGYMNFATAGTERMRIDSSGNVGIGNTTPSSFDATGKPLVVGSGSGNQGMTLYAGTSSSASINFAKSTSGSDRYIGQIEYAMGDNSMRLYTNATERMRIDSSGNLTATSVGGGGTTVVNFVTNGGSIVKILYPSNGISATQPNAASTAMQVWRDNTTGRSINAAGTVSQNGADYAEYMTKSGDFTVAKGDVIGINSDGKLTNIFADAILFCVKSTNPGLVGNDSWGNNLEGEELETARQTVDRIAFCGQVPVNVIGATAGQYIIPVNDNGSIKGEAVSNPTFEQYKIAVGKVIAIESDGRARIIVKVA